MIGSLRWQRRSIIRLQLIIPIMIVLLFGSPGSLAQSQSAASLTIGADLEPAATGSSAGSLQPIDAALAAGLLHSALINYDRRLYIWGDNTYGQLGLPDQDYLDTPQLLSLPGPVLSVSLGSYHSLAVLDDGSVWAWGRNGMGQLGTGNTENAWAPVQVSGLPPVVAVSAGAWHSLALGSDGSVWAWGSNSNSQVGDVPSETITDATGKVLGSRCVLPVQIIGSGMKAVSAGGLHSLCLDESGHVYAWGDNSRGQLGDGSTQPHGRMTLIPSLKDIRQIAAGYQHNLALGGHNGQDALLVWGDDSLGQLGIGSDPAAKSCRTLPERLDLTGDQDPANDRIIGIAAGYAQSAAIVPAVTPRGITVAGRQRLLVWGSNSAGQLALGHTGSQNVPAAVGGTFNGWTGHDFLPFDAVALGGYHLLVLSSKGLLAAAGRSERGQLGNQSVLEHHVLVPVAIPDVIRPAWAAGSSMNARIDPDGRLVVHWPAAQDNRTVTGYRIRIRRSDGQIQERDVGRELTWDAGFVSPQYAYEIQVWAYDSESAGAKDLTLSRLAAWLKPDGAAGDAGPADYFDDWQESVWQVADPPHHWRPDPQGILRPLEMPWDVSAIYPAADLPQPPDWDGFTTLVLAAAVSLVLFLLLILQRLARHRTRIRFATGLSRNI
jgi:alpha-tubulin suppressor-like RCC1 family protein